MASSRCVIRHTGGPIESLYRIFGIPNSSRCAPQRRAASSHSTSSSPTPSPWSTRLPRQAAAQRKILAVQTSSFRASFPPRAAHRQCFSNTSPTYKYKTVEEARSRGRLGVLLNISPLQALMRGAFSGPLLTVYSAPDTEGRTCLRHNRRCDRYIFPGRKSAAGEEAYS
jgi:hypothetical protein